MAAITAVHGLPELAELLLHLGPHAVDGVPFEACGGRLPGDGHGAGQGRQTPHLAGQPVAQGAGASGGRGGVRVGAGLQRLGAAGRVRRRGFCGPGLVPFGLFPEFDRFPVDAHRGGVAGFRRAEDVGMAAHQLGADAPGHGGEVETAALAGDPGMEHHLQQQIPQLLRQVVVVAVSDRIGHLVGLLQHIGDQGAVRLLQVPGTAVHRISQAIHHGQQLRQGGGRPVGRGAGIGRGWGGYGLVRGRGHGARVRRGGPRSVDTLPPPGAGLPPVSGFSAAAAGPALCRAGAGGSCRADCAVAAASASTAPAV